MANSISAGSGYINTYILGSVKSAAACTEIVLFNRNDFESSNSGYSKISLYNISTIYTLVIRSSKYVRLTRDDTNAFYYSKDNGTISGFNVILYINSSGGSAVGYTEFINTQGISRDVKIEINFSADLDTNLNIRLSNSLTQLRNSLTLQNNFTSDELQDFTSSKKILDNIDLSNCNFKYTNHLARLFLENKRKCVVCTGRNTVLDTTNVASLGIIKDIDYDPFQIGFDNFQVGLYNTDLVLYTWKKSTYNGNVTYLVNIISLTRVNYFGLPYTYTKNALGHYYLWLDYMPGTEKNLLYFAGRYAVFSIDGEIQLFDIEHHDNSGKNAWLQKSNANYNILVDPNDITSSIIEYPKTLTYNTAFEYIPELNNLYLDLSTYSAKNSISVIRKSGEWIILKKKISSTVSEYLFINMRCIVHISEDEYTNNKIHFINNQLIMIEYDTYFIIYGKQTGEFYTEKAKEVSFTGTNSYWNNTYLGSIKLFMTGNEARDTEYIGYYENKVIDIILKSSNIYETSLNLFRRKYYSLDYSTIPDIVCTFGGLIFYRKNNILNYL